MKKRVIIYHTKKFLIWMLVYFIVLWIFYNLIAPSVNTIAFISKHKIIYYLIFGLFIVLLSRLIDAGIERKKFSLKAYLIYWTIICSFLLWVFIFLFEKLIKTGNFNFLTNQLLSILILSLLLNISFSFIKRIEFGNIEGGRFRKPHFSIGFFVAIAIIILAYYYSQSAHYFAYISFAYGIPLFAYWIVVVIIAIIAWRSID